MNYLYPDAVLLLFCKTPLPGQVKTRLMTALTAQQAAEVHTELTLHTLRLATARPLCAVQLWCAPTPDHPFFHTAAVNFKVMLKQQQGEDLGERMHAAMSCALQEYTHAVLIGCDCPSLTAEDLEQALIALKNGYDCVVAATEDGGYSLIGLSQPQLGLFGDISWSTPQVMQQTRQCINELRLSCFELPMQWDVDTPR